VRVAGCGAGVGRGQAVKAVLDCAWQRDGASYDTGKQKGRRNGDLNPGLPRDRRGYWTAILFRLN
jgi:hypothetical protein